MEITCHTGCRVVRRLRQVTVRSLIDAEAGDLADRSFRRGYRPGMRESLIAGQYLLTEQVGRGGFAVVWRAHDERLHRDVAAKQLFLPPYFTDSQRREHRARTTASRGASWSSSRGARWA